MEPSGAATPAGRVIKNLLPGQHCFLQTGIKGYRLPVPVRLVVGHQLVDLPAGFLQSFAGGSELARRHEDISLEHESIGQFELPPRRAGLRPNELLDLRRLRLVLSHRLGIVALLLRCVANPGVHIGDPKTQLGVVRVCGQQLFQDRQFREEPRAGGSEVSLFLLHGRERLQAVGELTAPGWSRRIERHDLAAEVERGCRKIVGSFKLRR